LKNITFALYFKIKKKRLNPHGISEQYTVMASLFDDHHLSKVEYPVPIPPVSPSSAQLEKSTDARREDTVDEVVLL